MSNNSMHPIAADLRKTALNHAVEVCGSDGRDKIQETAENYFAFLMGEQIKTVHLNALETLPDLDLKVGDLVRIAE